MTSRSFGRAAHSRGKHSRLFVYLAGLAAAALAGICASAEEIDEMELFSDTSLVIDSSELVNNALVREANVEEKTLGISGDITASAVALAMRDWFSAGLHASDTRLSSSAVGTMFLDARLPGGIKGFGALETRFSPDSGAAFELSELFVDANVKKRVYVRAGKQVLQWGRCYFFNPTDLVNVEKKTFLLKLGAREGAFGARVHVPFGTRANLYGFVDMRGATQADRAAGAGRLEFLAGGTELAVGAWARRKAVPVYSFDISTTLFDFIIAGEAALSNGDNLKRLIAENGVLRAGDAPKEWIPRVSLGVTRFFDMLDVDDRLMVVAEFYYNHGGYEKNLFADSTTYAYSEGVALPGPGGTWVTMNEGPKGYFLVLNDLYEIHNYSKYYAALFTSVSRFFTTDMTLTLNVISNISQASFIVSGGLTYKTLHDFSLGLHVNGFLGKDYTEYTFMENALSAQVTASIVF